MGDIMNWIDIPETLKAIKSGKDAGTNSFIIQVYYDQYPFMQEGIFYFRRWCSIEQVIIKWLCIEYDIVVLFSAKDNIKFPDIEMERKFKNLMGTQVEFNPEDKYSRLASGIKLFELPRDPVESCFAISKALEQQKLKVAVVIQRAEVLLADATIDFRLLDSVKKWITCMNNHTLLFITDDKENIHHEIRQLSHPLIRHLEWLPPTKEDFEKLFTNLKIIKPHLFDGSQLHKLASTSEGMHYLELETFLNRLEKEKSVLTEDLLKEISENTKKETAKNKVGSWLTPEKPDVSFDDIGGLDEVKEKIDIKTYFFEYPELSKKYGIKAGGKLLLFGPPGTGKTLLAKAIATKLGVPFFHIKPADIKNMFLGQSENNVKKLFFVARQCRPYGTIFIEEMESLIPRRGSYESMHMAGVVGQFLAELDGLNTHKETPLLIIGATNRPQDIDPAALRPGRFDNKILIPLPDKVARKQIFYLNLHYRFVDKIDYSILSDETDGYSGADIAGICAEAGERRACQAVKEKQIYPITMDILIDVIHKINPSVSKKEMEWFREFEHRRGEIFR